MAGLWCFPQSPIDAADAERYPVFMDTTNRHSDEKKHRELSTQAGYDLWATIYDDENNPLVTLEESHVDRLMGDVSRLDVIDVGCGTGRHAIRLARSDARVTGVDFSEGMMAKARSKSGAERVAFVAHDLTRRLSFDDRSFDRVLCALVLDHIADVDAFFCELGRLCRTDGWIVISVMHPAMMLRGIQARFTDPTTGDEVRPQSVANQICDYVMAAVRAGLHIDHLSEHRVDGELVAKSPRAEKYFDWPLLLTMRCRPQLNA
jgi:ubiquinone/menaquinone biosynthesis C-methylase UbiE